MKKLTISIILVFLILAIGFVGIADNQEANRIQVKTISSEWNILKHSGDELDYEVDITEKNKQKTEVCIWSKTATRVQDLPNKFIIYDENGQEIEQLNRKQKNINGIDKYGYCRIIDTEQYIRWGAESIVMVYQDINQIIFSIDGTKNVTSTLYKNIDGIWNNTINDLFVRFDYNKWEFGANDDYSLGWEHYKYIISSEVQPYKEKGKWVFGSYALDLNDICSKTLVNESVTTIPDMNYILATADCQEELTATQVGTEVIGGITIPIYRYDLSVTFYSDEVIDPTYTIINLGAGNYGINATTEENTASHLLQSTTSPYDNLRAYWSFDKDDNSTVYDFTNYSHYGTYSGSTSTSDGCIYDDCAYFDGADDYLSFGDSATLEPANWQNFTIMTWLKLKTGESSTYGPVFIKASGAGTDDIFFVIGQNGANTNELCYYMDGSGWSCASPALNTNQWYHLALSCNGTGCRSYVNGTLGVETYFAYTYNDDAENWYMGQEPNHAWDNPINAWMDEAMIFSSPLSQAQIQAIISNQSARFNPTGIIDYPQTLITAGNNYVNVSVQNMEETLSSNVKVRIGEWDISEGYNESDEDILLYLHADGDASDASSYGNDGTLYEGASITGNGIYNNSFTFDGANDWINISDSDTMKLGNNSFTISAWVYPENLDHYRSIIGKADQTLGKFEYQLYYDTTRTAFTLIIWNEAVSGNSYVDSDITPTINKWYFVTAGQEVETNNVWIQVDGGTRVNKTRTINPVPNNANVEIGRYAWDKSSQYWNGHIDELMIWNTSLSIDEVKELYSRGRANWTFGSYEEASTINSTHLISTSTTNILPEFSLIAGTNSFYTPIIYGNLTLNTYTGAVGPDVTPPTWTGIPANISIFYNANFPYVEFNATDTSGISMYYLNDTINFNISLEGILTNKTLLSIQNYTLIVYVNDTLNNTNTVGYLVEITNVFDATPPTFTDIPANLTIGYKTSFPYVHFNATDGSGISMFYLNDTTNFNITYEGILTNKTILPIQNYTLIVSVNDTLNNTATVGYLVEVYNSTGLVYNTFYFNFTLDSLGLYGIYPDQYCFMFFGVEKCLSVDGWIGNLIVNGNITATGDITAANLDVSGDITATQYCDGIGCYKISTLNDNNDSMKDYVDAQNASVTNFAVAKIAESNTSLYTRLQGAYTVNYARAEFERGTAALNDFWAVGNGVQGYVNPVGLDNAVIDAVYAGCLVVGTSMTVQVYKNAVAAGCSVTLTNTAQKIYSTDCTDINVLSTDRLGLRVSAINGGYTTCDGVIRLKYNSTIIIP